MKLLTHSQQKIADYNGRFDGASIIDGPGWQDRLHARNQAAAQTEANVAQANGDNFINVCSYANRRLFTHIRASIQRNISDNDEQMNSL